MRFSSTAILLLLLSDINHRTTAAAAFTSSLSGLGLQSSAFRRHHRRASALGQSPPGGADGPRPVGRNRDADSIANKADVYFAQLKLDSRIRKQAFLDGDKEKSNEVFGDERVVELGETLQKDPQIQSRKEQAFETSAEEMIALMASTSSEETSTQPVKQISYKEKLQAARNRRTAGGAGVATQPSQSAMTTPPPPVPQEQRVTTPPTLEQAPPPSTNEDDDDDTRRQLRTLQGLLLKHRGGPGFGAGRLKDMEANRLKDALAEMANLLRAESGSGSPTLIAETTASSSSVAAPAPASVTAPASVAAPPPASGATASSSSETDLDAAIEYATATIQMFQLAPAGQKPVLLSILRAALAATVEALDGGAASATPPSPPPVVGPASMEDVMASAEYVAATMNMYKLAPDAQKVVSATVLRAALVTAMGQVDVCGGGGAAAAVVTPPSPPAVEMSPEERFGETLSRVKSAGGESAAAAAPAIISPEERFGDTLARVKRAGEEGSAPAEEVPAAEGYGMSSFGEIAAAMPLSQSIVDEMTAGDDGSAAVVREEDPRDIRALEKAYENMKRIGGNGRFGLDPNLSPADAQEVAESLIDMRQIFLKELDAANVAATDTTTTATAPAPITEETEKPRTEWEHNSGGTRFKQLLQKAKKSKGM